MPVVSFVLFSYDRPIRRRAMINNDISYIIDPMQAGSGGQVVVKLPAQQPEFVAMPHQITETRDVCCVALELSQSKWVCAFAPPKGAKGSLHTIKAGDHPRLVEWLDRQRARAELALGRPLQLAVCYEVGYDGFWLARILLKVGIRTVVFDPASFLKPRRGRWARPTGWTRKK